MRDRCSTLLLVIVAAFSALIHAAPPVPRGIVADDTYDFGSVRQGAAVRHVFIIKNAGDGSLRIIGAKLSMPGLTVRVAPVELPAHGEGAVTIELNTEQVAGAIEGRVQTRSWDDDKGQRHWKTEIVASSVEMLSGRRKKDYAAETAASALEAQAAAAGIEPDASEPIADDAGFSVVEGDEDDGEEEETLDEAVAAA